MDRPENVITTPNQTANQPHLTEAEIAYIRRMNTIQNGMKLHAEWCVFQRMGEKPKKYSKPLKFDENGKVVCWEGKPAAIGDGKIRKGTLRNKKCSCGSGKKYKKCCLLKTNG